MRRDACNGIGVVSKERVLAQKAFASDRADQQPEIREWTEAGGSSSGDGDSTPSGPLDYADDF